MEFDEGDVQKMESDIAQMVNKISEFRQTLPHHLKNTLDSVLSSHRPVLPTFVSVSNPLPPSRLPISELPVLSGTEEQDSGEKMIQLKEIIRRNAANIPKVVKRVQECIACIDKFDSFDGTIHPAFKRRRIN